MAPLFALEGTEGPRMYDFRRMDFNSVLAALAAAIEQGTIIRAYSAGGSDTWLLQPHLFAAVRVEPNQRVEGYVAHFCRAEGGNVVVRGFERATTEAPPPSASETEPVVTKRRAVGR